MARLPGVCNGDPETTVLAHIGIAGTRGIGFKPVDLCGTWACSSCHAVIDGGKSSLSRDQVRAYAMDGVLRTLTHIATRGTLSVRNNEIYWSNK